MGGGVEIDTDRVIRGGQLDQEKFLHENVTIMLSQPGSDSDPQSAEVTINGIYTCLPRDGNPVNVKRYVVAALANAKSMRVVDLPPFSVPVSMRVGVGVRG